MQKTTSAKTRHLSSKGSPRHGAEENLVGPAADVVNRVIERHPYLRMARDAVREEASKSGEFAEEALRVFRARLEASIKESPPPKLTKKP